MKIAMALVALAALCFVGGTMLMYSRNPDGRGMSPDDMFLAAAVGFLILAGARVLFITLARTR